jgi:hypothetical protein
MLDGFMEAGRFSPALWRSVPRPHPWKRSASRSALWISVQYARERTQFGKSIGSFRRQAQMRRHDGRGRERALLAYYAAWAV